MARRSARIRNVHAILALSAGLVLLVLGTFGWLGWMLLGDAKRREDVAKVLERSALDASADQIVASFRRNLDERRAALRAMPASSLETLPAAGAVLVRLSRDGVEDVQPPGGLLFAPAVLRTGPASCAGFAEAGRLEHQAMQMAAPGGPERTGSSGQRRSALTAARTALAACARSSDPHVRAEALFRLLRVQLTSGDLAAAEASYARLRDETHLGPSADLPPYGFLVRLLWISRARVPPLDGAPVRLPPPPPHETLDAAAAGLLDSFLSGTWLMRRATFEFYENQLRELIGDPPAPPHASDSAAAAAGLVDALWNEWRSAGFRSDAMGPLRSVSAPVPVLAITDVTPDGMIVALHTGDALARLFRDRDAESARTVDVMVTDEHGGRILGGVDPPATRVARLPLEPGLPWRLEVAAPGTNGPASIAPAGEHYLLGVLIAVALLVSIACYAIARGVLRESEAGRLQSDFVSAVSHEFRSPLTTLRQLTEVLADGRVLDEDRRRLYFDVLQQETSRLHHLVESLLDFGRMEAGRRQYQFEPLDLSDLVRGGIEEYRTHAGANGHAIEGDFSPDRLVVDADPEAMRRAVRNLLDNAVKYSPNAATVWVSTGCDDRRAVVRVRDEGIGIPAHEQSRIFDEFVRGDAAKGACIRGTGIGLAMVKAIVRAHHGDIHVSSEVGRGSTFELRVPLRQARAGSAS